jgi:hypothetical protein
MHVQPITENLVRWTVPGFAGQKIMPAFGETGVPATVHALFDPAWQLGAAGLRDLAASFRPGRTGSWQGAGSACRALLPVAAICSGS